MLLPDIRGFENGKENIIHLTWHDGKSYHILQTDKSFSDSFNLIMWDAPAHRKSRPFTEFTYEKAAITIKKTFDTEDIQNAIFIGQSMKVIIDQTEMANREIESFVTSVWYNIALFLRVISV